MRYPFVYRLIFLFCILVFACNSKAPRELEVVRFKDSYCKDSISNSELFTGRNSALYKGLICISWDIETSGRALFDLINFDRMCGFEPGDENLWIGQAYQDFDGLLRLNVDWDSPDENACGDCLYDFSFEIDGLEFSEALDVTTGNCTGNCDNWSGFKVTIPVYRMPAGIICKYADVEHILASTRVPDDWKRGTLHMPPKQGECEEDLTLIEKKEGEELCAATCSSTKPCPLEEILECQSGICQLIETW